MFDFPLHSNIKNVLLEVILHIIVKILRLEKVSIICFSTEKLILNFIFKNLILGTGFANTVETIELHPGI